MILLPVFNDWQSLKLLLPQIELALRGSKVHASILAVDDASSIAASFQPEEFCHFSEIVSFEILHLARNVGHQRAITLGLAYIQNHYACQTIIVMDADGEDQPADIPRLLAAGQQFPENVIFASRMKRSEGVAFRVFYRLYRLLFWALTGCSISFGNFSLIPFQLLPRLTPKTELWNHFVAGVMHAKVPMTLLPTVRGSRLDGTSKMNLISLIIHGLSAMSVYADIVAVRLILLCMVLMGAACVAIAMIVWIKFFTELAIPGWASFVVMGFAIILMQTLTMSVVLIFLILNSRSGTDMIPSHEYQKYILHVEKIV